MKKTYRSAMGKPIDMDNIRLSNEDVIAVGNMKVNARGDELGFGGKVVKTRNQIMDEYYRLNTPEVTDSSTMALEEDPLPVRTVTTPMVEDSVPQVAPETAEAAPRLRGNLANTIAKK